MATVTDLISKIDAFASRVGEIVKTKLSITDAASTYAAKDSLGTLAYKSQVTGSDLSDDAVANLTGPQGIQGFGYYGGYVYQNLTLAEWQTLGVLGSSHTYSVADTSNIRAGDFGLVVGSVTDSNVTQAIVNFKVVSVTDSSIVTTTIGFIVGEQGDKGDTGDSVTDAVIDANGHLILTIG